MKSFITNVPFSYKVFCPKPKDEVKIFKTVSSSKEWNLFDEKLKNMTGKEIREKFEFITSDTILQKEDIENLLDLFDRQADQENLIPLNLSKDLITAHRAIDEIEYFCFTNDFPLPAFFRYWSLMMESRIVAMDKLPEFKNTITAEHKIIGYARDGVTSITATIPLDDKVTMYTIITHNYFMVKKAMPEFKFGHFSQKYQRMILENTFKSAIASLEDNFKKLEKHKRVMGIEHRSTKISLNENLKHDEYIFVQAFSNNRSYAKIKEERHYLKALKNCNINFSKDVASLPVAEELEKGLLVGYTTKHLSLLIGDKRVVIAELKRNLDVLKKYGNSTNIEIEFTEKLISFVRQTRYVDYYPYKAIAKYTGMKKNEVKNLCKKIFGNDRGKALETSFDDLVLMEP